MHEDFSFPNRDGSLTAKQKTSNNISISEKALVVILFEHFDSSFGDVLQQR